MGLDRVHDLRSEALSVERDGGGISLQLVERVRALSASEGQTRGDHGAPTAALGYWGTHSSWRSNTLGDHANARQGRVRERFTDPSQSPIERMEIHCGAIENRQRMAARVRVYRHRCDRI